MHPAFSVIFFTSASGAGYGMLALAGVLVPLGVIPADRWLGFTVMGIALGLITAGLLSSTFHLGHPERAWRAFSQWRSSWLSREGIMAVLTYIPTGLFGIGWVFFENTGGLWGLCGIIAALLALTTIFTTAMIYRSLKPIPQWHNSYVVKSYLWLGLATGAAFLNAILFAMDKTQYPAIVAMAISLIGAGAVKRLYWRYIDTAPADSTANTATGLTGGAVRSVEWPHTEENYLLKEMGYRIARKHAVKLRAVALYAGIYLPLLMTLFRLIPPFPADFTALIAALLVAVGVLTERWLFFAEARHSVTLYYALKN